MQTLFINPHLCLRRSFLNNLTTKNCKLEYCLKLKVRNYESEGKAAVACNQLQRQTPSAEKPQPWTVVACSRCIRPPPLHTYQAVITLWNMQRHTKYACVVFYCPQLWPQVTRIVTSLGHDHHVRALMLLHAISLSVCGMHHPLSFLRLGLAVPFVFRRGGGLILLLCNLLPSQ